MIGTEKGVAFSIVERHSSGRGWTAMVDGYGSLFVEGETVEEAEKEARRKIRGLYWLWNTKPKGKIDEKKTKSR